MGSIPSCAAGVPIFRSLTAEGLEELSSAMRHRRFEKGEMVLPSGAPIDHLIVVAHGRLKVAHTSRSGREQVMRFLGPGMFLGEMALFTPATNLEGDVVALEETDVCLVPRAAVQSTLRRHPSVALRLVENLAQRLAEAEQLIVDLGVRDVGQRLAAELVRLAPEGVVDQDGVRIRLPVSWGEMAIRLGTTPESLSRRLKALVAQGWIRQEGHRTVIVRDLERLRAMIDG